MLYRADKYGNKLSQLGYGCMRFSKNGASVDLKKTEKEILYAIDKGINYFDTAYIYPGSEEALGTILDRNNVRDKVNIATKLPQYIVRSKNQIEKIFNEELKRLKTDHIDYYLMHMFTAYKEWENLDSLGIREWIKEKKETGAIRNIGFSYHGNSEMFVKILNAYDWDFCQIQYNYLDEHSQAGRTGLEAAYKKGVPVIIMEPLRGGKLVNLPSSAMEIVNNDEHHYSSAEWGLRWLFNHKEITCVLSGMNSLEMVDENIRIASSANPDEFKEKEFEVIDKIKKIFKEKEMVPCTGCRYCMPCPKGVDIPGNFYYYNLMSMEKKSTGRAGFAQVMGLRDNPGFASQCAECGKCELHCPQHISIREKLKEADKALRPLPYKIGINVVRKFMKRG